MATQFLLCSFYKMNSGCKVINSLGYGTINSNETSVRGIIRTSVYVDLD